MNIGVVIFPRVEELDFVGPWEMFGLWRKLTGSVEQCLLVGESNAPIVCEKGMRVLPHTDFAQCPHLDVVLVPGGQGTRLEVTNPAMREFVADRGARAAHVLSVCTGSFILHAAGLLDGRKATTHWGSLDRMRALEGVHVVEQRYVRDGKIWTSAGVSAGIDMSLSVIADIGGEEQAGHVQAQAEYYPTGRKYGDFAQSEQAPAYLRQQ